MRRLALAALAATIAFACPVLAAECETNMQLDHAREVAKGAKESGRFDAFLDLTGDDLEAFIKAANAQFGAKIPEDGSVEEILVIQVDGALHVFGFHGGCQFGHVSLPAMPAKTSAPALLPHGLRMI